MAPRITEVVAADFGTRLTGRRERALLVVDNQTEVPSAVGRLAASFGECDELVADVDECHSPCSPAQRDVEDPAIERQGLLHVADLQRDVVDPDQVCRHPATVIRRSVVVEKVVP